VDDKPRPQPESGSGLPQRRGLGRGLGALIPGAAPEPSTPQSEIQVDRLLPSRMQPRIDFDSEPLDELRASIQEHGVLQPILVRPVLDDKGLYEIVAGERRWRAAKEAGLRTVPVVIRSLDDQAALEAALVENLQREDLNPIERAKAYRKLISDFSLTQEALAKKVGRSQASVANTVRLLMLPPEVVASLEAGRITEGHARALLALDSPESRIQIWKRVESQGLSVRATEEAVKRAIISRGIHSGKISKTKDISNIEQQLSESIGSPVRVEMKNETSGQIQISFYTLDDLDRLLQLLGRQRPS
jgi:ParB family transcriptional regulator, chromosome partitioning protein